MSEWQPARLVNFHKRKGGTAPIIDKGKQSTVMERIVRVRRKRPTDYQLDCDSEYIYEVHAEDCGCLNAHVCEHEILTD
jgi:hypothetical protein